MATDFEVAKAGLEMLTSWARDQAGSKPWNEAETRLYLIDRILFGSLAWNQEDCRCEEQYEGRYIDYGLGRPAKTLIVEAKKEGVYFELPSGMEKRVCKLSTILDGNKQFQDAVRQVLQYCNERGVGLGAVCNGQQIAVFLASRDDGVPPLEGLALVYTSLDEMSANFREFWQNLSKPGLAARNIHVTLKSHPSAPPPEKLSKHLAVYPGLKKRNPFQTELKILGELFIEDVGQTPQTEDEFLKACYCPSGALSQYAEISRKILQTRYSAHLQRDIHAPSLQPAQQKGGISREFITDVLAAGLKRRPIILLGDVGVGKTTFIRHFIRIGARDILEKAIVLYVDFGKEPALAADLQAFVLRRCEAQLREQHGIDVEEAGFVRGVYHKQLARFSKGIYSGLKDSDPGSYRLKEIEFLEERVRDRAGHLRSCLDHISRGQKQQIVLFLDNVDQRPLEFQDQTFLIAQSLAETWPVSVFVSLRPATFFHSRVKGSLAAYQPRVFTVSPPRVDLVINKRMEFARSQLDQTGRLDSFPAGLSLKSVTLRNYVSVLIDSFNVNRELVEFIDNLSGGNVRAALDFVNSFVGSGHVDAQKILDIQSNQGSYTIPVHEFMRAVIYGDFEYYDPQASPVTNLFDISQEDGREHFCLGNVLCYVERHGSIGEGEGFVEASGVYDLCQALGFSEAQVKFALRRAEAKGLLEPSPRFIDPSGPGMYRITTVGAYTARRLPRAFNYVDAMVVDTPIVVPDMRVRLWDARTIIQRLERCELFREYLDQQWGPLAGKDSAFDWASVSADLASDIQRIKARV